MMASRSPSTSAAVAEACRGSERPQGKVIGRYISAHSFCGSPFGYSCAKAPSRMHSTTSFGASSVGPENSLSPASVLDGDVEGDRALEGVPTRARERLCVDLPEVRLRLGGEAALAPPHVLAVDTDARDRAV